MKPHIYKLYGVWWVQRGRVWNHFWSHADMATGNTVDEAVSNYKEKCL